jgi:hypothetical protein
MANANVERSPSRRIQIPVAQLEFDVGGRAIWVHSELGMTVLRVTCSGEIKVIPSSAGYTYADLNVIGDMNIFVPVKDPDK